jgi:predicted nucleic acid-binding protein
MKFTIERLRRFRGYNLARGCSWDEVLHVIAGVNETITLLQRRGFFSASLDFLEQTRSNEELQIVCPDSALQSTVWDLFGQWGGSGANAMDCMSFAIMKR